MGRYKHKTDPQEHYTKLIRQTIETPAWKALSCAAQALYPWLKFEWRGSKFNNNGQIRLSVKQATQSLGVCPNTAARAFRDLQAKGFIVVATPARMGIAGQARGPAYELTEIKMPSSTEMLGRMLYKQWSPGQDFAVQKAKAGNPLGKNGGAKVLDNDPNVIKISKVLTGRKKQNPISKIKTVPS